MSESAGLRADYPALFKPGATVADVAPALGMSKSSIYAAIKANEFPFPTIRVGERIIIPTAPIREALGIHAPADETSPAA